MDYIVKHIKISSDHEIAGKLVLPKSPLNKAILFLHGGKPSNKDRFTSTQEFLGKHSIISLAIDFRGCGDSGGSYEDGSLNNRLKDAQNALNALSTYADHVFVCGSSMGGHVAVKITNKNNVSGLILVASAAYGQEAENKPLNEDFTKAIRKENSWHDSPVFSLLKFFDKPILTIYGQNDQIIPQEVREKIRSLTAKKGEFIELNGIEHGIFNPPDINAEKSLLYVQQKICSFILEH